MGKDEITEFGDFEIKNYSTRQDESYVVRKLQVKNLKVLILVVILFLIKW